MGVFLIFLIVCGFFLVCVGWFCVFFVFWGFRLGMVVFCFLLFSCFKSFFICILLFDLFLLRFLMVRYFNFFFENFYFKLFCLLCFKYMLSDFNLLGFCFCFLCLVVFGFKYWDKVYFFYMNIFCIIWCVNNLLL